MKLQLRRAALLSIFGAAVIVAFQMRNSAPVIAKRALPAITLLFVWELWYFIYLAGRKVSYRRREHRKSVKPAYSLTIPDGVLKAEQYAGVAPLNDAQHVLISDSVGEQGSYFQTGILAASLPPVALLMLSLQLLVFPFGGEWALGLIAAEVLCLGRLAFIALTRQKPTSKWMEARIRAELIRREQYLVVARIGPYLNLTENELAEEASRRAGQLEGFEKDELRSLISPYNLLNTAWLNHMPVKGDSENLCKRINTYLYRRVGKQLLWFSNEIRDCEENESLWSKALVASLLGALFAAAFHLMHLLQEIGKHEDRITSDMPGTAVAVLAISLPPVATAVISMKNMYAFQGRTKIYAHQRTSLLRLKGELEAVAKKAESLKELRNDEHRDQACIEIDRQFKTLAALVEASLANEMDKWILLMEREAIEVNA